MFPLTRIPSDIVAVSDYAAYARTRLNDNAWVYLNSGAGDELTLKGNRQALDALQLRSRVLVDMQGANTQCELWGKRYAYPMWIAPLAYQQLFHADGELATLQAAAAMNTPMIVSTLASTSLESLAQQAETPLWFQLYMQADRAFTGALIQRAEQAGYEALVITVDAPLAGLRNQEQRAGFKLPDEVRAVNLQGMRVAHYELEATQSLMLNGIMAHAPTWRDIEYIKQHTKLPLVLKGITHPADALKAKAIGIDAIIVSNHGGRTLDTLAPSIQLLTPIADCLQGDLPILWDSGIRRGTDIVKALALGATAVLIGRPVLYGLATAGALGVAHVLKILQEELELSMALSGCRNLAEISRDLLVDSQGLPM